MAAGRWPFNQFAIGFGLWPSDYAAPTVRMIPAWAIGPGAEAAQIESVRALIPRYEAKIQRLLARVWGTAT